MHLYIFAPKLMEVLYLFVELLHIYIVLIMRVIVKFGKLIGFRVSFVNKYVITRAVLEEPARILAIYVDLIVR
jgi:hypothetical protein